MFWFSTVDEGTLLAHTPLHYQSHYGMEYSPLVIIKVNDSRDLQDQVEVRGEEAHHPHESSLAICKTCYFPSEINFPQVNSATEVP